jgi:hypothetical protein
LLSSIFPVPFILTQLSQDRLKLKQRNVYEKDFSDFYMQFFSFGALFSDMSVSLEPSLAGFKQ